MSRVNALTATRRPTECQTHLFGRLQLMLSTGRKSRQHADRVADDDSYS